MQHVSHELLSRYVDGQVSKEEARTVAEAIQADPEAARTLDELRGLGELFGQCEAETVAPATRERLYRLGSVRPLEAFEPLAVEPVRRPGRRWSWAAAAAVLLLALVGIRQLTYRPEVTLTAFTRQVLGPGGEVKETLRSARLVMRSGDELSAGPHERVSCRLHDGSMIVLLPGTTAQLGDPRKDELVELERGTVLCTVVELARVRTVRAAGFALRSDRADFGMRLEGLDARAAGLSGGSRAQVTVAVSRGSLEVSENGESETVAAYECVVLRRGRPVRRTRAWEDPLYGLLLSSFSVRAQEVIPGYFTAEHGVQPIPMGRWSDLPDGRRVLAVTDVESAGVARYLVLQARASSKTALRLTRVRPDAEQPGRARAVSVLTPEVGTDWTVVAVPLSGFGQEGVERRIPAGFGRLVRFELEPATTDVSLELKATLWAARPPAGQSEVER